mmetsp:Transcript_63062/g.173047  ORF Transcript_63062/g.173047 Transcript_63062/m.173047 type:complete len:172 (+) Transcript_63062:190-705(+)
MASSPAVDSNWFHGALTRSESMALLVDQPDGTFLVRVSSRSGCYALDLVTNEGKFLPLLIETVPSGVRLHEEPTLEIKGHEYATLADLVAQNSTWLMYPFLAVPVGEPYNPMAVGNSRGVRAADAEPRREGDEEGEVLMRGGGGGIPRPNREGDEEGEVLMKGPDFGAVVP